jgi:hypothetical protein
MCFIYRALKNVFPAIVMFLAICSMPLASSHSQIINGVAIAFSPSNPDIVFSGVTGSGRGLYRSTDAGLNWQRMYEIDQISEIAIHPDDERVMYLSAIHQGVLRSLDGGVTWTGISTGLPTSDVMRVRIAGGYPVRVFAVTLKHGIYRMVDEEL